MLLAIPVLDNENKLVGIITVDDVVDVGGQVDLGADQVHPFADPGLDEDPAGAGEPQAAPVRVDAPQRALELPNR